MFKAIKTIEDVRPFVSDKEEIKFLHQPHGILIGCYLFMDSHTFDSAEAKECRGIAFDSEGKVISRPLHKFFNVGEKECLKPERLCERDDLVAIYEKLDGSMLSTAFLNGRLFWRSKKAFHSHTVKMAEAFIAAPGNARFDDFGIAVSEAGLTATFEFTHPKARIVVAQDEPALRLLHVRDNYTGEYVLLNPNHIIYDLVAQYEIPRVKSFQNLSVSEALLKLETMSDQEGYVFQFADGDMVKAKCPWYLRFHRSITFMRERDIALLALNEELDDVKNSLVQIGMDLGAVEQVESRLKSILVGITGEVEAMLEDGRGLSKKEFALKYLGQPYFGLAASAFGGHEIRLKDWYIKNRLKDDFDLRVLVDDALVEGLNG